MKYSIEVHRSFFTISADIYVYFGQNEEGYSEWLKIKTIVDFPILSKFFNLPIKDWFFNRKHYKRYKALTRLRAYFWVHEMINKRIVNQMIEHEKA